MSAPADPAADAPAGESGAATAPPESTKRSLEDSLSSLDESTKTFVLGQVAKARTEAQNLRERLKTAEPKLSEYERMVKANQTDQERQAEELSRWQTEAEKWRTASVGSRIEALAAPDFADPSDAVTALESSTYLTADGRIDEAAIKADLAAVLERKPHWRRPEGTSAPRVPIPNPHQGSGVNGKAAADPAAELAAILHGQLNGSR